MKIEFKPISVEDKEKIAAFTCRSTSQNCDFAVMNICSWQFFYHSEYAIVNDFLILRFKFDDGCLGYMFPLGDGDVRSFLDIMFQDAIQNGEKDLCLMGVTLDEKQQLDRILPDRFHYISKRDYFDYIYRRLDLAVLKGKRYQSKRNHVNKFTNKYNYEYVELTPDLIPECLEVEERWRADNTVSDYETLLNESRSMTLALKNFEKLGGMGGAIRVDGRIVAFSFGSPINEDTFCVHVEKADANIEGLYSVINQMFSSHIPEKYTFMNREEDLGIEGLRKAKLSYLPSILLEKYVAIISDTSEVKISAEDAEVKNRVMDLWRNCFSDTEAFVQFFFSRKYKRRNTLVGFDNGEIVTAMQLMPYKMTYGNNHLESAYIAGVCTQKESRGKGLSSNLMQEALVTLNQRNVDIATLIPATENLFDFYAKSGFITVFEKYEQVLTREDLANNKRCVSDDHYVEEWDKKCNFNEIYSYFNKSECERDFCVVHTYEDWMDVLDDLYNDGGKMLIVRDSFSKGISGLALVLKEDTNFQIKELMTDNEALSANVYCYLFSNHIDCQELTIRTVTPDNKEQGVPFAMARVTNVSQLLNVYVKEYPTASFAVEILDNQIAENRGVYRVENGAFRKLEKSDTRPENLISMDISQFTEAILGKKSQLGIEEVIYPYMSMMLE